MKVLDIAINDLKRSVRSLFFVGMMFAAPLLIAGLIYFAFGGMSSGQTDLPTVKMGLVNLDRPPANLPALGDLLSEMLQDESVSSWLQSSQMNDESSARAAVTNQQIGLAVIIPVDFSEKMLSGRGTNDLVMVQDPTLTIGPLVVKNMITSFLDGVTGARIALQVLGERLAPLGITLDSAAQQELALKYQAWFTDFQRALYHDPNAILTVKTPGADPQSVGGQASEMKHMMGLIMIGQLIFFSFYTAAFAMMSILREEEEGTLARLFTTPTDRTIILTGKYLAMALTVIGQLIVLLLLGRLLFGIQWGQLPSIALVALGSVVGASGLGVLLISLVKNSRQAGPVIGGGLTALGMLSGLFSANIQMPGAFNLIANFIPQGWALRGWKLALDGAPSGELVIPLAVLVAMGLVMFFIGAWFFRRRYA